MYSAVCSFPVASTTFFSLAQPPLHNSDVSRCTQLSARVGKYSSISLFSYIYRMRIIELFAPWTLLVHYDKVRNNVSAKIKSETCL